MTKGKTNNGQPLFKGNESAKGQGFKENPQNINKKGRTVSIRKQLKELLATKGKLKIPKENIISIEEDGSVIIKMPTEMQLAMKLKQIAMSGKNNNTLKAIQMIMEQIDGKPKQAVDLTTKGESIQTPTINFTKD